jgi:hypothetical protein
MARERHTPLVRRPVAALAVALFAALAACSADPPAGTDGDLMDDWAQLPTPAPFRPVIGECHEAVTATASIADRAPVSCAGRHVAETVHVGAAAEAPAPPAAGSAGARSAYAECGDAAERFLGGPWRAARIGVRVAGPAREAWIGGARWFRCDVVQADLDGGGDTSRTGSLKDVLIRPSPLGLGCFDATVSSFSQVRTMTPVDCTTRHSAEFAGLWTAPDVAYAEQVKDRTRTARGCRSAIAQYTRVPDDDDMPYRTGWISHVRPAPIGSTANAGCAASCGSPRVG